MLQGTLYIISAPSGAGKSSLIQALLKTQPLYNAKLSISHTTRSKRPSEIHGKDYFFISKNEFEIMIDQEEFLEYAQIFNHYYGTAKRSIEKNLASGTDVFLDIDWQGAQQIRKKNSSLKSIFILPPSTKELNRRLRVRNQDSEDVINYRMTQAILEISHYYEYDYLIINDDFNLALADLKTIIRAEHLRTNYQKIKHAILVNKLLAL